MKLLRSLVPSATVAGLVMLQVSCGGDASGPSHAPASIEANSSLTLTASPGAPVAELPSVIVRNASGAVLAGAPVTFTVTGGGGTVTGGNATTNSDGVATVGSWTLGPTPGQNTLNATAASLPAVTFTATGTDACDARLTHALGTTTNGELSVTDCKFPDNSIVDFYNFNVPTAGTYLISQSSTAFDTYLLLFTGSNAIVGFNDDIVAAVDVNSRLKVLVPAGNFIIGANAFESNAIGAYTLSSAATTDQVTNCEDAFAMRGIASQQSLQSSDCSVNGVFGDEYVIAVFAGQPITVSMTSTEVDSYLEISQFNQDGTLTVVASNDDVDSTQNARVTFAPTVSNFYLIAAKTKAAGVTGAYTLSIQ